MSIWSWSYEALQHFMVVGWHKCNKMNLDHRYRGGRYQTLCHLDPGMGFNLGVFGFFSVMKIIVFRQVRKLIACTAGLSVKTITRYICNFDPLFSPTLTPNDSVFFSVHTQWPPFSEFQRKISNFSRAPCAFGKFPQFSARNGKYSISFDKIYTEWPYPLFWEVHTKKVNFVGSHTQWPLFSTNFNTECPWFRSSVGTYPSLSYSNAPRGCTPP